MSIDTPTPGRLLRRGFLLECATLGWNVVGIVVLALAAIAARAVALAGFGLDSLIEIGASAVVIWELSDSGELRRRRALRMIGIAFALLAVYLLVQSTVVLVAGFHPGRSPAGIAWTAVTAVAMFALAAGKAPVPRSTTRFCAPRVASLWSMGSWLRRCCSGWWWADPLTGYILVLCGGAGRHGRSLAATSELHPTVRHQEGSALSAGILAAIVSLRPVPLA